MENNQDDERAERNPCGPKREKNFVCVRDTPRIYIAKGEGRC
jgi:hypothetical protein